VTDSLQSGFGIGDWEVYPQENRLKGRNRESVLEPKVMDVLVLLARRQGDVVSRQQILDFVWADVVVGDEVVSRAVSLLRTELGDDQKNPRYIKTISKRGYCLIADVVLVSSNEPQQVESVSDASDSATAENPTELITPRTMRKLSFTIVTVLALALAYFAYDKFLLSPNRESAAVEAVRKQATTEAFDSAKASAFDRSVAVLSFTNISNDLSNDHLSEGLSDELRDHLAQVAGMRVMARSSSIQFRGQNLGATTIAERLNVSRVIEGRFNRQGNRLLLSVQLIDATTGIQLWGEQYERASRDLLLMQQDLARDLVSHLMPELQLADEPPAPSAQQVSAHDLLLLGRQYEQQVTDQQLVDETKLQKAIDYYRQALLQDPQSAEAHARLGKVLLYQGDVAGAEESIFKALDLDSRLSEAHATLGAYYWISRQAGIGAAYRRAIELNPNNADALSYYAGWVWMQGEPDQAANNYRLARDVDPMTLVRHAELGYMLAFEGSLEEAESVVERILALFPTAPGYLAAARIAEAYGMPDEAIGYALRARLLRPDDPDIAGQLAESHARIGDFDSAAMFEPEPGIGLLFWQGRYSELIDLGEELMFDQLADSDVLFLLAFALNTEGRFDESLRILDLAGMPDTVLSESRRAIELHYLPTMIGALQGVGDEHRAVELAEWNLEFSRRMARGSEGKSWADHLAQACMLSTMGKDDEALDRIELLPDLRTIVWLPWLKDHTCFQKFVNEPRYASVISAIEARLAGIRQRLPETLALQGLLPTLPDQK
jgi:TolB-like protein/DNA-binding winged helix-turn-helix (wHTH) protein